MPGRNIYRRRKLGAGDEKEAPPPRRKLGGDERENADAEGAAPGEAVEPVEIERVPSLLSEPAPEPPPPPPPAARRVVDDEPEPVKPRPALVVYDPKPAEQEAAKRRKRIRY